MAIARDDNGNIVTPVRINTICPVDHIAEVKTLAWDFMHSICPGCTDTVNDMMPLSLGPVGGGITHVFCTRPGLSNEAAMEVNYIATRGLAWCADREYTLSDNPEDIKSKLCCISCDDKDLLSYLGLEVK